MIKPRSQRVWGQRPVQRDGASNELGSKMLGASYQGMLGGRPSKQTHLYTTSVVKNSACNWQSSVTENC